MTPEPEALIQHTDFLRRLARPLVADEATLDDVLQETWLAALLHPPRKAGALRSWLGTVVLNAARRISRAEGRRRRHETIAAGLEGASPAGDAGDQRDLAKRVVDAVFDLEEPYRRTVLLRYFEDLSVREIAKREQIPLETARTRLRRAIRKIRERLDGRRDEWAVGLAGLVGLNAPEAGVAVAASWAAVAAALLLVGTGWTVWTFARDAGPPERETEQKVAQAVVETPRAGTPAEEALAPERRQEAAPADSTTDAFVFGTIVDPSGEPIAGARVMLFPDDLETAIDAGDLALAPELAASATAGPDGSFRLPWPPERHLLLYADAPGHALRSVWIPREGDAGDIVLPRARALHGTVRDLDDRPVVGALVSWRQVAQVIYQESSAITGADGSYRIEGISTAWRDSTVSTPRAQVLVEASGFAPLELNHVSGLWMRDDRDDIPLDIYLPRGATIKGRVLDAETGLGIARASVRLESVPFANGSESPNMHRRTLAAAASDADGAFTLERVPAWGVNEVGFHTVAPGVRTLGYLKAQADGYAPAGNVNVAVPDEGAVEEFVLRLAPAAGISGRVVDEQGEGLAGLLVYASVNEDPSRAATDSANGATATTNEDGAYRLNGLPASRRGLVEARIGVRLTERTFAGDPPVVQLAAGATVAAPEIELVPREVGAWVVVEDSEGAPIHGAFVEEVRTNREGHAPIFVPDDADRSSRIINVSFPGFWDARLEDLGLDPSDPPWVTAILKKIPRDFRGRTDSAPADAPAAVELTIREAGSGRPVLHPKWVALRNDKGEGSDGRAVRPGVYRFSRVPLGRWSVIVRATGFARHEPLDLDIAETGRTYEVALELKRGLTLAGTVRASDGTDLRGFIVDLLPVASGEYRKAQADESGRFRIEGILPGETYRIMARSGYFTTLFHTATDFVFSVPQAEGDVTASFLVHPGGYAFVTANTDLIDMRDLPGGISDETRRRGHDSFLSVFDVAGHRVHRSRVGSSTGHPVYLPFGTYRFRLEIPSVEPRELQVTIDQPGRTDVVFEFGE